MPIVFPEKSLPTLAIVGRTNVGKSTLFNRLIEERRALVSPVAGTTRTSNIAAFLWRGERYRLIDTGGVDFKKTVPLESEIQKQVAQAFKEAQVILFVVDLTAGLLPQEKIWANELRRSKLPIILVGNKADNAAKRLEADNADWLKLNLGRPAPISAANGSGIGDLLDQAIKKLKRNSTIVEPAVPPIKVAIIGRPNVGKSTLFNSLIGEERVIISPIAHTTRESHDTLILKDGEPFLFVDTAGIRRQNRRESGLESAGVGQALTSLEKSDIALLVLDASEPFSTQDKHLVQAIQDKKKALILIINKWDLFEKRGEDARDWLIQEIDYYYPFLHQAPKIFISAKSHLAIHKLYPLIKQVAANWQRWLGEEELKDFLKVLLRRHPPTRGKGTRFPKIYSLKQIATAPPTFEVAIKQKTSLHEAYMRFIANALMERFDFAGAPVIVYARKIRI